MLWYYKLFMLNIENEVYRNSLCVYRSKWHHYPSVFVHSTKQSHCNSNQKIVCLFVCLFRGFSPTREFFTHIEPSPLPVKAANFDICSVLMAIEQWEFFSVPHLLWHGPSVYTGHLRGPVTLTPIAERLAVELSLPVLTI